jgi:hypothetical protein
VLRGFRRVGKRDQGAKSSLGQSESAPQSCHCTVPVKDSVLINSKSCPRRDIYHRLVITAVLLKVDSLPNRADFGRLGMSNVLSSSSFARMPSAVGYLLQGERPACNPHADLQPLNPGACGAWRVQRVSYQAIFALREFQCQAMT